MRGYKIYIGIASVLLILYLVAQYNRPQAINWEVSLKHTDKIPYGTFVLHDQLESVYPNAKIINTNKPAYEIFSDTSLQSGNYLIVAKRIKMGKSDFRELSNYIKAGNNVFMAALDWGGFIKDTLKVEVTNEFGRYNPGLNFTNPKLHQTDDYVFQNNISNDFFARFDTAKVTVLGKNEYGHTTFIKYSYGKGNLYLFANPITLTNYSLLTTKGGANYGSTALSYLPKTKNIYWDQYQNHDVEINDSQLRVFFQYPALQWAYYLSLAGALLFVVYEVKRRQRIIPVVEPLKNTTLEFVTVVGKVYYEQRDNTNIAGKKIRYFLDDIRNQLGIKTSRYDSEFIAAFAKKTGVDIKFAERLFNHISYLLHQSKITDQELILLNQLIEKFYSQYQSYGK